MSSRHTFIRRKLQGLESYAYISLQRLDIQRAALYNIIAQRESKLNFQMAAEQKKLAHAAKRDSGAQKTIALLGALFLPGAWLASVFSMSFFNFQNGLADDGGNPDLPIVAEEFWIYWAVTIPVTAIIVGIWFVWERRRDRRYMEEDTLLEQGVEQMEKDIQRQMRARTMSKAETWNLQNGRK
jgi:Mg2+ and Co2+ transporter CorA